MIIKYLVDTCHQCIDVGIRYESDGNGRNLRPIIMIVRMIVMIIKIA